MTRNALVAIRRAGLGLPLLVALSITLLWASPAKAGTTITNGTCPVLIAQSGDYSLDTDVGPCLPGVDGIDIVASNVTLQLNSHSISGTATSGTCNTSYGIYVMGTSLLPLTMVRVIGSGTISNFVIGFRADNSAGSFVKFTTVTGQCPFFSRGFSIQNSSSQWKLEGNVVRGTPSSFGIYLNTTTDNDLVRNDVNDSIVLVDSSNNTIVNNTVSDGGEGIAVGVFGGGNNNEIHANTTNNNANGLHLVAGSGNNVTGNTSLNNRAYDMQDNNPNCDSNKWEGNKFNTANQPCIH